MAKKKKQNSITSNQIKVKIYMRFGAEVRQKRVEFMAEEKRDGYNTLVAVNEKHDFDEDCDFKQKEVYRALETTYDINNDQKNEALKKLDAKIDFHKKRIKALETHPQLNKYANIWDEKRRLRELEIFRNFVSYRSPNGSYFKVEDGLRVYEYESIDGFLIPIWHGVDNLSDYPDHTSEKKITMQENANFNDYFANKGKNRLLINVFAVVLIMTAVMFGVNLYAGFKLLDKHQELDDRAVAGAELCSEQTVETHKIFTELMQNAFIEDYIEKTKNITKKDPTDKIKQILNR
jgi:hypothetical protein